MPFEYEQVRQMRVGMANAQADRALDTSYSLSPAYSSFSNSEVQIPSIAPISFSDREGMMVKGYKHPVFGGQATGLEDRFDGAFGEIMEGGRAVASGVASNFHSLTKKLPSDVMRQFSDLIGDNAEDFPEFTQGLVNWADDTADVWGPRLQKEYQRTAIRGGWHNYEGVDSFLFDLGGGAMSLGQALGITAITRNPAWAAAFFGALQQTSTYVNAVDAGKSPMEAFMIANAAGIAEASLEFVGLKVLDDIIKTPARGFGRQASRALRGSITEGIQEGMQTTAGLGIESYTGVNDMSLSEIMKEAGNSALVGAVLGGGAAGIGGSIVDSNRAYKARSGRLDEPVINELIGRMDETTLDTLSVESHVFEDAMRPDGAKTSAGKQMSNLIDKVNDITKGFLEGQDVREIFRSESAHKKYVEDIITGMNVKHKRHTLNASKSAMGGLQSQEKGYKKELGELAKEGEQVVEKFADSFDEGKARGKALSPSGESHDSDSPYRILQNLQAAEKDIKNIDEEKATLTRMTDRKDALASKKDRDGKLSMNEAIERTRLEDVIKKQQKVVDRLDTPANLSSLKATARFFKDLVEMKVEEFASKYNFKGELSKLKRYKEIQERTDFINTEMQRITEERSELAKKAGLDEMADYLQDQIVPTKLSALNRLAVVDSKISFLRGRKEGSDETLTRVAEAVKALKHVINSVPLSVDARNKMMARVSSLATSKKINMKSGDEFATELRSVADELFKQVSALSLEETKQNILDTIIQTVKNKRPTWNGGKANSKMLDIDTNNAFVAMSKILSLTKRKSKKGVEYSEVDNLEAIKEVIDEVMPKLPQDQQGIVMGFVEAMFNKDMGVSDIAEYADELQYVVDNSHTPDAESTSAWMDRNEARRQLQRGTDRKKSMAQLKLVRSGLKHKFQDTLFNPMFETLDTLWVKLGVESMNALSLIDNDMEYKKQKIKWSKKLEKAMEDAGLTHQDLHNMKDASDDKIVRVPVERNGKTEYVEFTRSELVQRYMVWKNEAERATALDMRDETDSYNLYTKEFMELIDEEVTSKEKAFATELFKIYDEMYERVAPVYRRVFRVDMPRIENYAPAPKKGQPNFTENFEFVGGASIFGDTTPGILKKRTGSKRDYQEVGVVETVSHYMNTMEHFASFSEKISSINRVIKDPETKSAIIQKIGQSGYNRLESHIKYIEDMHGQSEKVNLEIVNHLNKVFIVNKLMFKPNQILKQFSSFFGLLEDVPASYAIKNIHKIGNPLQWKKWRNTMRKHPLIENRHKHIDADYDAISGKDKMGLFGEESKWVKIGMYPTAVGDVAAIYAGGGLYLDYLVNEKGMSPDEALEVVVKKAEQSQQSSLSSNMSILQKTNNPFIRSIRMFSSSAIALTNMQMKSFAKWRQGRITDQQFYKSMAIYQVIIPVLYNMMAGNISVDTDDPEEILFDMMHASLKGNMASLPVAGEAIDFMSASLLNEVYGADINSYRQKGTMHPMTDLGFKMTEGMMKALDEDITMSEVLEGVLEVSDAVTPKGLINLKNIGGGAVDMYNSEYLEGGLRSLGYTEKQAKKLAEDL